MIRFDHLVLRVSNFRQALTFYQLLFQFLQWSEIVDPESEKSIGFRQSDGFTIWLGEVSDLQIGKNCGHLDHYAFHCESRESVEEAHNFCQSQEWTILTAPKAYPQYGDFYGFSFEGPDKLKLEFVTR